MTKFKNTKSFRILETENEILALILALRTHRIILTSYDSLINSKAYVKNNLENSNMIESIGQIVKAAKVHLVDLNRPLGRGIDVSSLLEKFENDTLQITHMRHRHDHLANCCPNIKPLALELIEFVLACRSQLGEQYRQILEEQIEEVLSATRYVRNSEVSSYMIFCPYFDYFKAYFITNPTIPHIERTHILNTIVTLAPRFDTLPEKQIAIFSQLDDVNLEKSAVSSLFKMYSGSAKMKARQTLKLIQKYDFDLPFEIDGFVEEEIFRICATENAEMQLPNLFEGMMALTAEYGELDWAVTFVRTLEKFSNKERLIKVIGSLLCKESLAVFKTALDSVINPNPPKSFTIGPVDKQPTI